MYRNQKIMAIRMLIILTAFIVTLMWAKILIFKSPEKAAAMEGRIIPVEQSNSSVSSIQQSFSTGLTIKGRNDRLAMDFTSSDNEPNMDSKEVAEQTDNMIRQIKTFLNLEAIVLGNSPQAFINDRLYNTGDKIDISDGNVKYECVIEKIRELEVLINCFGTEISLKIANPDEVIENQ